MCSIEFSGTISILIFFRAPASQNYRQAKPAKQKLKRNFTSTPILCITIFTSLLHVQMCHRSLPGPCMIPLLVSSGYLTLIRGLSYMCAFAEMPCACADIMLGRHQFQYLAEHCITCAHVQNIVACKCLSATHWG